MTTIDLQWVTDIKVSQPKIIKMECGTFFNVTAFLFTMEDGSTTLVNAMAPIQQTSQNNVEITG